MDIKRFYRAFKKTIFTVAVIHYTFLLIYAVTTGHIMSLSIARILELKLFFKNIEYTPATAFISLLPVLGLLAFHYYDLRERK